MDICFVMRRALPQIIHILWVIHVQTQLWIFSFSPFCFSKQYFLISTDLCIRVEILFVST